MVNLDRAIYSIAYYWHGIPRKGIPSIIWLFDKLHHLHWYDWSNVNNLPFNQTITDKIDEMIENKHLRLTNRWKNKYGSIGLEPANRKTSPKIFLPSEKFNEEFRMAIRYYIDNNKEFKQLYIDNENTPINIRNFYIDILDTITLESRTAKLVL